MNREMLDRTWRSNENFTALKKIDFLMVENRQRSQGIDEIDICER